MRSPIATYTRRLEQSFAGRQAAVALSCGRQFVRWLPVLGAAVVAMALAGCGGSGVAEEQADVLATRLCAVATTADDPALGYVRMVSRRSYTHYLADLLACHDGDNRQGGWTPGPDHNPVRNTIRRKLLSSGLRAGIQHVVASDTPADNVVAVQRGTTRPQDVYIISAHYDSTGTPGADDDASGVAGLLEAARVMAGHPSAATVYFIAFDGEEFGGVGSVGWVASHQGVNVRGMVSLDMIAYNPAGSDHNTAAIYAHNPSSAWANGLAAAVLKYEGMPTGRYPQDRVGDYWPFEENGWPACLLIEGARGSILYGHTARDSYDTPGYIDTLYATKMTRAVVGYLCTCAGFSAISAAGPPA